VSNVRPIKSAPSAPSAPPPALHDRAIDNLQFIRETMERAGSFTAISGWGVACTGVVALIAAPIAGVTLESPRWLVTWLVAAALSFATSTAMTWRKARVLEAPVTLGTGRKLALAFFPSLVAGAVLTAVALRAGWYAALPGMWLMLYGAAVMAGGALSVPVVPVMGASFMFLGAAALAAPLALAQSWSPAERAVLLNVLMAVGFGGLHLVFGTAIARRYGG
jgi:hypothetical protein